jgi:hypothetical protein
VEILFRELLRLVRALITALLNQSWQPLEGALGEMGAGGGLWLLVIAAGILLVLVLVAGLVALMLYFRRRGRQTQPAVLDGNRSARHAVKIRSEQ